MNREREYAEQERLMKNRILELENTIKADINTKNDLFDKLGAELGTMFCSFYLCF